MSEYDELIVVKNLFYIGAYDKAIKESEIVNPDETNIAALERKTFYLVRIHLANGHLAMAKDVLENHLKTVNCPEAEKEKFKLLMNTLIQFTQDGTYNEDYMKEEFERLTNEPQYKGDPRNKILIILICYILYSIREYDFIVQLAADIKDVEISSLLFLTFHKLQRYDYMEKALEEIKAKYEESSLTQTLTCLYLLTTGNLKEIVGLLNETIQKFDKSVKMLDFVALAMIGKGQVDKALKMYEKVIADLELKKADKLSKFKGNSDVVDLISNYIICLKWMDTESPSIEEATKLLINLGGQDPSAAPSDFEDSFAEACQKIWPTQKSA